MEPAVTRSLRPTSVLPFVACGLLLLLQLINPAPVWNWLLIGLGTLLLASYGWARQLRDRVVAGRVVTGTWVVAGDQLSEHFSLANNGEVPVLWARVRDYSAVPGYRVDRVETAGSRQSRSWTTSGTCERRGVFRLGPWDLEMADPFGLFEVTHHYPAVTTIVVYPRPAYLPRLDLPRGRSSSRATRTERAPIETITPGGIRDYAPGDSLRRVHWPATARHDRLIVREFDREPSGDVWIVVDMDESVQAGHAAEATQEYAAILAASLASQFVREGELRSIGLLVTGRAPVLLPPAQGQAQHWRILQALAEAEPSAGAPLAQVLADLSLSLGNGRTVIVITPSQTPDWIVPLLSLMARGNAPAALLLDSTTFDPPRGSPDGLAGLRGLLSAQRIPCYVLAQGFPFQPIDRIRRKRHELRTLSATGRVIEVDVEEEV